MLLAFPIKIVQTPRTIVIMSEADGNFRQIHLDGRALPTDPQPSWMGYSVGRWEGETFVVDTIGFNDRGRACEDQVTAYFFARIHGRYGGAIQRKADK